MIITGKCWSVVLMLCGVSLATARRSRPRRSAHRLRYANPGRKSRLAPASATGSRNPRRQLRPRPAVYELTHNVNSGLGPVFNARACSDCHQNPVSGGASQFTELRVGHTDANGNFVNPTIPIDDGASSISGRSLVNDRAVVPEAQEHVPETENIPDVASGAQHAGRRLRRSDRRQHADGHRRPASACDPWQNSRRGHRRPRAGGAWTNRIGRFGWKDQHSSSAFLHRRRLFDGDRHHQPLAADERDDHRQSDGGSRGCAGQLPSGRYRPARSVRPRHEGAAT